MVCPTIIIQEPILPPTEPPIEPPTELPPGEPPGLLPKKSIADTLMENWMLIIVAIVVAAGIVYLLSRK